MQGHERPPEIGIERPDDTQGSGDTVPVEPDQDATVVHLEELKIALAFIDAVKSASLENGNLSPETLMRLRQPIQGQPSVGDPDVRLSLDLFLAVSNASQETYTKTRNAILHRHPSDPILTHDSVKRKVRELSGVDSIVFDMCINTCVAFTGPFAELEICPKCNEDRYDPLVLASSHGKKKVPRQKFHTIPLGPQLQALRRSPQASIKMRYRQQRTEEILAEVQQNGGRINEFDDYCHGRDYLNAVQRGDISPNDTLVLLSLDGAQLYQHKASDCWIYIWVILDYPPDLRYKKKCVLPGGFIPGPNKPKNVDSFLFPGIHHVAAIQKEGLPVWDALDNRILKSSIYFAFGTADTPGMTYLSGLVGHSGAYGCRLYCTIKGRLRGRGYYPAHLKPDNYDVAGSNHDDINLRTLPGTSAIEYQENLAYLLGSTNQTQYERRRLTTGISKPSIFSGLDPTRILGIPNAFPADLMHLVSLNTPDLIIKQYRGKMECEITDSRVTWDWAVLVGDTWKTHGEAVARATPYLPGSFDRPPRNPAEKISSGYKAWEYLMYLYGLCPGLYYKILPDKYWQHFCKLVMAIRVFHQRRITLEQLMLGHRLIIEFIEEYEEMFYQRRLDRIHFCRPSLHSLAHLASEVTRVGPAAYLTQWTLERTIGNLGEEIKQPSKPFENLSQRGLRRSQVNALKAMIPDLEPDDNKTPRGAEPLGDGYVLLRAKDSVARYLHGDENIAVRTYFEDTVGNIEPGWCAHITRWARLQLPNGQIARSAWKEKLKPLEKVRMARNVKVCLILI